MGLNARIVSEQTRQHQLCSVADCIDSRVFDDEPLVRAKQRLEGLDDLAQVRLVAAIVVLPLSVENVVQRDHVSIVLRHDTAAYAAQLLHVGTDTKQQTQVHAECTDISTGLARHPEDTQVAVVIEFDQLALMDRTDTELALDGRNERRALEERAGQRLEGLGKSSLAAGNGIVHSDDADIFLARALLGFDESRGAVNADNCVGDC
jgi:hypothetical protein